MSKPLRENAGRPGAADSGHGAAEHASAPDLFVPLAVYSGSALADYASTRYALSHGAREANPLLQRHLAGWKAVQVAALVGIDVALQRKGHRRMAKGLRITAAVMGAGLAVHNVNVARRQR